MKKANQTEINDKTKHESISECNDSIVAPCNDLVIHKAWYRAAVGTAVVAGVFSLIICAMLVSNHFHSKISAPLDSKELDELKTVLLQEPKNDSIKEQIRAVDVELRKEYFQRRRFSEKGGYLLLAGIVVFLIGIKSAATYRKKLPMPQTSSDEQGQEAHAATVARWSVSVFGLAVGGVALVLAMMSGGGLTKESLQAADTKVASYPSPEEIKKNWPRFRGPGGLGISAYTNVPSSWNGETGEGILWKTPVLLPGENSPIVWGNRVFLTGATEEKREVYCFDADSGQLLWQKGVNTPGSPLEPPEVMEDTGYAAPTAVTDGQRVYAIFANGDVACFDFDGEPVWADNLGNPENMYGHASSLAIYQNLLLVLFDQGSNAEDGLSELMALEARTGRTVWETERPVPNSWASPIVINTGTGEQIITCANPWVIAYNPATGGELWRAECLDGDVAPSPVFADGLVFAVNDYAYLAAIRPDGAGNVTETHIAWKAEDGLPDICSPLSNGELVFLLATYGILTCYDAKTGKMVWENDFETSFKASPSLVGDKVYLMSEEGVTFIFAASREYKELGRAALGEAVNTCPAFMDGRIYIRGKENLYCIGNNP